METSNFDFLKNKWSILYDLGKLAEQNLYLDSNTTIIKLRIFAEKLVDYIFAYEDLEVPREDDQFNKLKMLARKEVIPDEILEILHSLRKNGNKAVHNLYDSLEDAKTLLSLAYKTGVWFRKIYGKSDFEVTSFVCPERNDMNQDILEELAATYETKLQQLEQELVNIRGKDSHISQQINNQKGSNPVSELDLSEKEKQKILDDKFNKLMNIYNQERKFITTAPIADEKSSSVWNAVKRSFQSRECVGYWGYPIFSKIDNNLKEPNILIIDKNLGIIIININFCIIEQLEAIKEGKWIYNDSKTDCKPIRIAEDQLFSVLNFCDQERELFRKIGGRVAVVLPNIGSQNWSENNLPDLPVIFCDQQGKKTILKKIKDIEPVVAGREMTEKMWNTLLSVLTGQNTYQKEISVVSKDQKTRNGVKGIIKENIYQVDMQQEEIGKSIPPGPQRIRGIAGSGKTVLLCQKAAHMHLKHPDWKIALVFFTRSLYDSVTAEINKWVQRFSNGERNYNPDLNNNLQVLHAWGASSQPGLYRIVCKYNDIEFLHAGRTELGRRAPNKKLIKACQLFLENADEIKPIYDAILIDEAQDLIADEQELKYNDKQSFFWLAYKSIKPGSESNKRRLIWAYDEAQSLNTLKIPTAPELFGADPKFKRMVSGFHKGGIRKSEIMNKCYRTPGSILVAAHAVGMGLLRPEGMLTGFTTQEDWENIGYEVKEGSFHPVGQKIVLHRPKETVPNKVPEIWEDGVIDFNSYATRENELAAVVRNIKYNIAIDKLKPSRDILVIVLGDFREAKILQNKAARELMGAGVDIFIPKALDNNQLNPGYPNYDPNKFWNKGGVTISNVYRAKGNEAYMLYVVGMDKIAAEEDNVALRNQLFVALTRTKGWLSLSGIGDFALYDEFEKVLNSGRTFEFTFKRPKVAK